jgi:XTP/dITP diphosphohydrolase
LTVYLWVRTLETEIFKMTIVFATHNQNKIAEIQELMPEHILIKSLTDIGCHNDIPETAETLTGNAKLKSEYIFKHYKLNCFADDTGLEIEALNGEPGVKSARYASETERSDERNMEKVLRKLSGITNRKAQFRTVISLYLNGIAYVFEGICEGQITEVKSGAKGFGYDPIFIPAGHTKTFAEMTMAEKNAISHRGKAVAGLINFLNNY